MNVTSENNRFRILIKQLREHYNLSQNDFAHLMGIKLLAFRALENGRGTIDLSKAASIAKVLGLHIWEILHPDLKFPELKKLPTKTRELAISRQGIKRTPKSMDLQLPEKIKKILSSGKLPREFTSNEVWKLLPTEVKNKIKASRITDSLNRGALNKAVENTGKKRSHEKVYRLK